MSSRLVLYGSGDDQQPGKRHATHARLAARSSIVSSQTVDSSQAELQQGHQKSVLDAQHG
jgi:hypothetical protein